MGIIPSGTLCGAWVWESGALGMVLLGWDGGGRARTPGAVGGNPELTGLTGELLPLLLLLLLRF